MKQIHINDIVVNNGLSLRGNTPLDDRLVWEGFDSLYVYEETPETCPLYGQAYQGMIIIMLDTVGDEKKSYLMFLYDASPYIPGMGGTVTPENYLNYWRQDSIDYDKILRFVSGHGTTDTDKVVGHYGDITGKTAAELNELYTKELISRILFEFCRPEEVSEPALKIGYNEESAYALPVEVGCAMPKSTEFDSLFTQAVWRWVSSFDGGTYGPDQVLCDKDGELTFYLNKDGVDAVLDSVTEKVVEGTEDNGRIFAVKGFVQTGNAKDSRGNDIDPETGEYYHEGVSGNATSDYMTVTGGWRAYANASEVYAALYDAWINRNVEPGEMPESDDNKLPSPFILSEEEHKFYVQWPSATTSEQKFHVWVPVSYQVTGVKAANNFSPIYEIEINYELEEIVSLTNRYGVHGQFKLYSIGKEPGITNAEVTITKA